ncbi:MAG TPA: folate-binding protein YgfZ [Rhodospirillaceae bacterium]|nr:folate-binding protein YgfZ [Rhodospirillaceae bacterium]
MSLLTVALPHRALIAISGEDRVAFLQGLISNDVTNLSEGRAVWAAFLTPQGKFLYDLFLAEQDDELLLETETARRTELIKRLGLYKLRSRVSLRAVDDFAVFAMIGKDAARQFDLPGEAGAARALDGGKVICDPRLAEGGLRLWLADSSLLAGASAAPMADWDDHRIRLGLPDGSRDLEPEQSLLLESGFDQLNGIDWQKGCYLGQEVTARTRYRGLVKRRLIPVNFDGPPPQPKAIITQQGTDVGVIGSVGRSQALAMIRLDALDATDLLSGETRLAPCKPAWMTL